MRLKVPYHTGSDLVAVHFTKDKVWARQGVVSDYPNSKAPRFDLSKGYLHVPQPRNTREDIQEQFIRDAQIPPEEYHAEANYRVLLEKWPVEAVIEAPLDILTQDFKSRCG